MSLYLSLPQRYMGTHYRWLRMMIALTVTEMEIVRKRPATGYPVLLLLDEFAGLKRMEVIENAVAQIAGFGVKLFLVLQSLEQLKGTYKENWETFLANSGLKVFFNIEDHFSREYVSKLIGETEVIRQVHSTSESLSESEGRSESVSHSRSESAGRSSSHGTSVSEGTNRSVSTSESRGISRTSGRTTGGSYGSSWRTEGLFSTDRSYSRGSNWSQSDSQGTSQGWSRSESEGVSQSRSESHTEGTSHTQSSGVSESSGKTLGSSRAHKRRE